MQTVTSVQQEDHKKQKLGLVGCYSQVYESAVDISNWEKQMVCETSQKHHEDRITNSYHHWAS